MLSQPVRLKSPLPYQLRYQTIPQFNKTPPLRSFSSLSATGTLPRASEPGRFAFPAKVSMGPKGHV